MTQKIPYPPSQDALIAALKMRGDSLSVSGAGAITILYRSVCNLMDVMDEQAVAVEDLCKLLASVKPVLDEYKVFSKMLESKYPDEPMAKDLLETTEQIEKKIGKEVARIVGLAEANLQKGKANGC